MYPADRLLRDCDESFDAEGEFCVRNHYARSVESGILEKIGKVGCVECLVRIGSGKRPFLHRIRRQGPPEGNLQVTAQTDVWIIAQPLHRGLGEARLVRHGLRFAFLSPNIVESILNGDGGLTLRNLRKVGALNWRAQHAELI